jgi:hypothetical protein
MGTVDRIELIGSIKFHFPVARSSAGVMPSEVEFQPHHVGADEGVNRRLIVNHYCLKDVASTCYLRNWRLEASNDNINWTTLKTYNNDKSLTKENKIAHWNVDVVLNNNNNDSDGFRLFRIFQFGVNATNNHNYLFCYGFELYGTLKLLNDLVNNRRHLRTSIIMLVQFYNSIPLTNRKSITHLALFKSGNNAEYNSAIGELVSFKK